MLVALTGKRGACTGVSKTICAFRRLESIRTAPVVVCFPFKTQVLQGLFLASTYLFTSTESSGYVMSGLDTREHG